MEEDHRKVAGAVMAKAKEKLEEKGVPVHIYMAHIFSDIIHAYQSKGNLKELLNDIRAAWALLEKKNEISK